MNENKNNTGQQQQLPIGYYLKLADKCLTNGIDEIQFKHGINRIEWQVLNSINERPEVSTNAIFEQMEPIADKPMIESILKKYLDNNQVVINNNILSLTFTGKELHKLCMNAQIEFRKKAMHGISEAEYKTTIATLQKLIANISLNSM
ncbi:MAG: hypothetical protein IT246_10795 [Bacteroidia bacterium]|nr:hypothetical protein [Bacteroidia bacterium]